jgi:hypothetical protein
MLKHIDPKIIDALPDWSVFAFAGFLVATVSAGVFIMVPAPVAEPSCAPIEQITFAAPSEPPQSVLERPQDDWLWMAPEDAPVAEEAADEPRRRRRGRRG